MLTVWSVCVGDKYDSAYVYALKEMVEKNLTIPHEFRCITKRKLDGIQTRNPPVPYQGWWSKLGLFHPGVATGSSLYFDLDVVITGNIDYLAEYTDTFSAPANWAASAMAESNHQSWHGLVDGIIRLSNSITRRIQSDYGAIKSFYGNCSAMIGKRFRMSGRISITSDQVGKYQIGCIFVLITANQTRMRLQTNACCHTR